MPGFAFAIRGTFVKGRDIWAPLVRPAFMAAIAFTASFFISRLVPTDFAILEVLVGCFAALFAVAPLFLFKAYRNDVDQLLEYVRRMRSSKPAKTDQTADAEDALIVPMEPETFSEAAMDEGFVREEIGVSSSDEEQRGAGVSPDPKASGRKKRSRRL